MSKSDDNEISKSASESSADHIEASSDPPSGSKRRRSVTDTKTTVISSPVREKKRIKSSGWDAHPTKTIPVPSGVTTGVVESSPVQSSKNSRGKVSSFSDAPESGTIASQRTEAESMAAALQNRMTASQLCRVYVGSLDYSLTEGEIRQIFSAFGNIVNVDMPREGSLQRSKGFCFIEYESPQVAANALSRMAGLCVRGRPVKLGRPTALATTALASLIPQESKIGYLSDAAQLLLSRQAAQSHLEGFSNVTNSWTASGTTAAGSERSEIVVDNLPESFSTSDVEEVFRVFGTVVSVVLGDSNPEGKKSAIVTFPSKEAADVAAKTLDGFVILNNPVSVRQKATNETKESPREGPSRVLSLSNIVRHAEDTDESLQEEIKCECSKLGHVKSTSIREVPSNGQYLEKSTDVMVAISVEFETKKDSLKARQSLDGRWFDGRKIKADFKIN